MHPHLFRTYSHRGSAINPTIVEAVCATISVPSHFTPVEIGPPRRQQKFIGAPLGVNNPTRELLNEAGTAFGNERRVAQIISIGGGSSVPSLETEANEIGVDRLLKGVAADCEMVARDLTVRLFNVEAYRRFNVEEMGNTEIDSWDGLGDIESHTRSYIESGAVTKVLDISLKCLRDKVGTITLGRLSKCFDA